MKVKYLLCVFLFLAMEIISAQKRIVKKTPYRHIIDEISVNDTIQRDFILVMTRNQKHLQHTIYATDGDCSSVNVEIGTYEYVDDFLILYSYWASADRMQSNVYPYGFRKRSYQFLPNGNLVFVSSKLYIESYMNATPKDLGIQLLKKKVTTKKEKELLQKYILAIEKEYQGEFIFGEERQKLEKEVRKKLQKEIAFETKHWDEIYNGNYNK